MSLDLYFHPPKTDFDTVRAADYAPTAAQQRAQRKLIDALLTRYSSCKLVGDAMSGCIADFPLGELRVFAGYLHLNVHGTPDLSQVQAVVDEFASAGWLCVDPQDAGFASGSPARMQSLDELIGSRFVGLRLLRDWASGLLLEWAWDGHGDDGRTAQIEFVHASGCAMPDPMTLLKARLASVDFRGGQSGTADFDNLHLVFDSGASLQIHGCVFHKGTIMAPRRRRR
jgi:hypothetical protein